MNVLAGLISAQATTTTTTVEFHADHTWLPETAEILWGTLSFLIIAFLLWKFAAKPVRAAMQARTDRIAKELQSAATAKTDADAEAARCEAGLADLDGEKARILAEARDTAERVRVEGIARNDAEVMELEVRADADIEAARSRAASDLHAQVASLVGDATERIVIREIDDATLQRLVEDYIAKVGVGR
jgi:F-type H+-transporting ATPase subunit b